MTSPHFPALRANDEEEDKNTSSSDLTYPLRYHGKNRTCGRKGKQASRAFLSSGPTIWGEERTEKSPRLFHPKRWKGALFKKKKSGLLAGPGGQNIRKKESFDEDGDRIMDGGKKLVKFAPDG